MACLPPKSCPFNIPKCITREIQNGKNKTIGHGHKYCFVEDRRALKGLWEEGKVVKNCKQSNGDWQEKTGARTT